MFCVRASLLSFVVRRFNSFFSDLRVGTARARQRTPILYQDWAEDRVELESDHIFHLRVEPETKNTLLSLGVLKTDYLFYLKLGRKLRKFFYL